MTEGPGRWVDTYARDAGLAPRLSRDEAAVLIRRIHDGDAELRLTEIHSTVFTMGEVGSHAVHFAICALESQDLRHFDLDIGADWWDQIDSGVRRPVLVLVPTHHLSLIG